MFRAWEAEDMYHVTDILHQRQCMHTPCHVTFLASDWLKLFTMLSSDWLKSPVVDLARDSYVMSETQTHVECYVVNRGIRQRQWNVTLDVRRLLRQRQWYTLETMERYVRTYIVYYVGDNGLRRRQWKVTSDVRQTIRRRQWVTSETMERYVGRTSDITSETMGYVVDNHTLRAHKIFGACGTRATYDCLRRTPLSPT